MQIGDTSMIVKLKKLSGENKQLKSELSTTNFKFSIQTILFSYFCFF
jgi:hypothetical protein